jgi:coenzyme F420-reducing hydrogenase gamma subunit
MSTHSKPRLAVFKFASCDGCQLSLLDAEDELLAIADKVEIAYFVEATSTKLAGPYDVSLVEGSVTTEEEIKRIQEVRRQSRLLVTIGACATAGGIQALRNWAEVKDYVRTVYVNPAYIHTLETSTPISAHVAVDFELRGCPISKEQLLEVLTALLIGRRLHLPGHSVCMECKRRGTVCVTVSKGIACLGPAVQAGCGAICPAYGRGCYGCFGPMESANPEALSHQFTSNGTTAGEAMRLFRGFTGFAEPFKVASEKLAQQGQSQ